SQPGVKFRALSVGLTSDGGFIVAGGTLTCSQANPRCSSIGWIAKLDSAGQIGSGCSLTTPKSSTVALTFAIAKQTSSTTTDTTTLDSVTPASSVVTDSTASTVTMVECKTNPRPLTTTQV